MRYNKLLFLLLMVAGLSGCSEDEPGARFKLLTAPTWVTDSLLANGTDAGVEGGLLYKFKGEAKFNKDGTGYFGIFTGTWELAYNETQLVISTDSLAFPLTTEIEELTISSLKVTTAFPNLVNPSEPTNIRMTFKSK